MRVRRAKRAFWVCAVLAPTALLSGAFSAAVSLDTSQPEISEQLYGGLPLTKVRMGDLALADAFSGESGLGASHDSLRRKSTIDGDTPSLAGSNSITPSVQAVVEGRALSALSDTPYSSAALRQLALVTDDNDRQRRLLGLSRRLSRRDVAAATQLAQLQFLDGDTVGGLSTLDQALGISDRFDERIFPLMLAATRDPNFATLLRERLASDPAWAERLAAFASGDTASAPLFASLADSFPPQSRARIAGYGSILIDRLASDLQPEAAFAAYNVYSETPQDSSAFGTRPFAPIDWKLVDNLDAGARIIGGRNRSAEIFANARRSGEAARILLRLNPGDYTLSLDLIEPRGEGGRFVLERVCVAAGVETASSQSQALYPSAEATSPINLSFEVPQGCPFQSLRLAVEAESTAISVLVGDVRIEPTRQVRP